MGTQQDEATRLSPLRFPCSQELVYDALGQVAEVSELCLPHDELVGRGRGISHFEAHRAVFGHGTVAKL